jgi:ribosomal-protein-alanine N-acetyltransferase
MIRKTKSKPRQVESPDANSRAKQFGAAFVVHLATPEDLPAMRALETETPSAAHWPERAYLDIFSPGAPPRIAFVLADENQTLCGFVIARVASGDCELENIAVAQNTQRRGVGTLLIRSLVAAAGEQSTHRIFLEVRESNRAARALYEACGFAVTGRRARYYSGPEEDAILYVLSL